MLQKSNLAGTSNDRRWGNQEEKAGWWKCGSRSGGWWMMRWDGMGGWEGVVDGNLIKEYWLSLGIARAPIDLERWQMNCSLWRDVLIPKDVGQSIICLPCGICNHVYCVWAGISTQSWFCCVIKTETSWYYQLWFSFEEEQTPGGGLVEKNQLVDERGKHGLSRPRTHSWAGRQSGALAKLS